MHPAKNGGITKAIHSDLLAKAFAIRAAALQTAGRNPRELATITSQFCSRLESLSSFQSWRDYFRATTGVGIEFWDDAFEQTYLQSAATCENDQIFKQELTLHRPEIHKLREGMDILSAERSRLEIVPLNLETEWVENWRELREGAFEKYHEYGIGTDVVQAVLEPLITARYNNAISVLAAELAAGHTGAPLEEMTEVCQSKALSLRGNNYGAPDLLRAAVVACEAQLAPVFEMRALQLLSDSKAELLAMGNTTDALLSSDFFSVRDRMPILVRSTEGFRDAYNSIREELVDADAELDLKRQATLSAVTMEINAAFAKVDAFNPDDTADQYCENIYSSDDPRIAPFRAVCDRATEQLATKREKIACDKIWADLDMPKEIREGTMRSPRAAGTFRIEEMVCDSVSVSHGLEIIDNSGFFTAEFLLARQAVIGGTLVRFTAVLKAPEGIVKEWTLTEPKLNDKPLSSPKYKTSEDFLACISKLEICFREN
jgi:hypothetical protein